MWAHSGLRDVDLLDSDILQDIKKYLVDPIQYKKVNLVVSIPSLPETLVDTVSHCRVFSIAVIAEQLWVRGCTFPFLYDNKLQIDLHENIYNKDDWYVDSPVDTESPTLASPGESAFRWCYVLD